MATHTPLTVADPLDQLSARELMIIRSAACRALVEHPEEVGGIRVEIDARTNGYSIELVIVAAATHAPLARFSMVDVPMTANFLDGLSAAWQLF